VDNVQVSSGVTAAADFINNDLLSYLTAFWNASVVPLFTAVGASAPTAPSQSLANAIDNGAESLQQTINATSESVLNSLLSSQLGTIQPYVQAITAAVWNYGDYPIVPNGDYSDTILTSGLFPGVDVSNSSFVNANCAQVDFSYANLTGCDFTGANLSGANLTGATGYAAPAMQAAPMLYSSEPTQDPTEQEVGVTLAAPTPGPFYGSVLFGTTLTDANLNLNGAFYDRGTIFSQGIDPGQAGLRYFSAEQFVAGNNEMLAAFGTNFGAAAGAFAFDKSACGCPNKQGIRTDVITGELELDGFNEFRYFKKLGINQKRRVEDFITRNPETNLGDFLAVRAAANARPWSQAQIEEFLFSNSDLIARLGGVESAMKEAQTYFVNKGIYQGRYLNNDDLYNGYVKDYSSVLPATGSTFDQSSLAHHFVTVGYTAGQTVPTEFM
jgi:uncharacterized protein YjbI with pentapeptide repeats